VAATATDRRTSQKIEKRADLGGERGRAKSLQKGGKKTVTFSSLVEMSKWGRGREGSQSAKG